MDAKHEPSSSSSFVISLATAALRGILVVAALVVGFVVLSSAFPTGDSAGVPAAPSPTETEEPQTPEQTASPTQTQTPAARCPDASEVPPIQVLNGTTVTGLAADAAARLVEMGYKVPEAAIANATRSDYRRTIVLSKRPQAEAADCLAQEEFRGAQRQNQDPEAEYAITVILGMDYADRQG
ncbi:MAG TPA: LytR C-terminal domain-containing protein [Actinomycetota bacterium]|nr:LytR C-terminal domain-containing protein [Actinomycetota bacterium]